MSLAHKEEDAPSIHSLAREARADGVEVSVAIDRVMARLTASPELLRTIVRDAVLFAATEAAKLTVRSDRSRIIQMTTATGRNGVFALANGMTAALLDMPIAGGVRLRDARRDQVAAASEFYSRQAQDMSHKGRWFALIAQSVPEGRVVGDVLTDARAAELFNEARHG
jgi:hypothetical protein